MASTRTSSARTQWMKGVTDLLLLALLEPGPSYGYELGVRLTKAGLRDLNEATVYGALRRLETSGLLSSSLVASGDGPARRYYEVNDAGRAHRRAWAREWQRFATTVDGLLRMAGPQTTAEPVASSEEP